MTLFAEGIGMNTGSQITSTIVGWLRQLTSFSDLNRALLHLKTSLVEAKQRLSNYKYQASELEGRDPRRFSPEIVINSSPQDVRALLASILGISVNATPADMICSLRKEGRGLWGKAWRNEGPSYHEILKSVCRKLSLSIEGEVYQLEQSITVKLFNTMWEGLSDEERVKIITQAENEQITSPNGLPVSLLGPAMAATGIVAAQASGFAVYMAASTVVGAASHALSIALPFAFYTSMSHAIALAIGPVGWVASGLWALKTLLGDYRNYTKLGHSIALIAGMRGLQTGQWQAEVNDATRLVRAANVKLWDIEDAIKENRKQYKSSVKTLLATLIFVGLVMYVFCRIFVLH